MNSIKRFISFWYRIFPWIVKFPANSCIHRLKIFCDYLSLYRLKGISKLEYYEFEFDKQTDDFRRTFLGRDEQRVYLSLLNPVKFYSLARNKFLAHKILENTGVRKSQLYCYYQPEGRIFDSNEIASTLWDVRRILLKKDVKSCVIKETENSHGEGVIVVKGLEFIENDCKLHYYNGKTGLLSEILQLKALIFESLITQTEQFNNLNPSSVNTIRFMTTLYPNGDAKIVAAFIKIGRAGSCVDNAGAGGNIDASIDLETGEINNVVCFNGWRNIVKTDTHPDSNTLIKGLCIDNWHKIIDDIKSFQKAMPYCKAAGWDIAITENGPVVIEVNDFWDRTGQYFINRGWRNEIRDCYLAWLDYSKSTGITYCVERSSQYLSSGHLKRIIEKL